MLRNISFLKETFDISKVALLNMQSHKVSEEDLL